MFAVAHKIATVAKEREVPLFQRILYYWNNGLPNPVKPIWLQK